MLFDSTLMILKPQQVQFDQQATLVILLVSFPQDTPDSSSLVHVSVLLHPAYPGNKGKVDTMAAREHRAPTLLLKDPIHMVDYDRTKIWEMEKYSLSQK